MVKSKRKDIKEKVEYPYWLNIPLWEEYKLHRKEIKPKMTPRAEKMAIKNLKGLVDDGDSQDKIIEQSIAMGWKGLFAVKNNTGKNIKPKTYAQAQDAERREMCKLIKDIEDEEKHTDQGTDEAVGLLPTT